MKNIMASFVISLLSAGFGADWLQFQGDPGHTGASADAIQSIITAGRFGKIAGSRLCDAPITASPVIKGDTLYVGAHDNKFYSVDADNIGRTFWSVTLGGKIHGSAAMGDGHIVVGCGNGMVYLISIRGAVLDSFQTSSGLYGVNEKEIFADMTYSADKGHFYVGNGAGYFYALAVTGNRLDTAWSFRVPSTTHYDPAIYTGAAYGGGYVYVPCGDSRVWKLRDDGSTRSIVDSSYAQPDDNCCNANAMITNTLTLYNGHLFFGRVEQEGVNTWVSLPLATFGSNMTGQGAHLNRGSAVMGSFAAADGYVYIPTIRGSVLCKDTGTLSNRAGWRDTRFSAKFEMSSEAGLALTADYVVEVTSGGTLRLTGKTSDANVIVKTWAEPGWAVHEKMSKSAPAISNGRIFFGSNKGYLFAFGDSALGTKSEVRQNSPASGFGILAAPNPFNPALDFQVRMPERGYAIMRVFDISGQLMAVFFDGFRNAGNHRFVWKAVSPSGRSLPSGTYIIEATFGNKRLTVPVTLAR